ncbi:hypothetical protein AHF37_11907 [Paragonimus kellicotti]|nr:hypothetical protein AHF37_11907 [Paragonimus kellicotti]
MSSFCSDEVVKGNSVFQIQDSKQLIQSIISKFLMVFHLTFHVNQAW